MLIVLALVGCKTTKPITPIETKVETKVEYRDRVTIDTTYIRDSIYIKEKADTIYVTRYRTEYVERLKIDTAYLLSADSIYIERVQIVERKRTKYDKVTSFGFWLLLALVGLMIYLRLRK